MVIDVIFDYVGKSLQLVYNLLNHPGLSKVVGASPFWIIVSVFTSISIIGIACRLSFSLFSERNGGS